MKIKKRRTTEDDFNEFKTLCRKYQDWMGCYAWNVEFYHETSDGYDGECWYEFESKRCTLCLGKKIDADKTVSYIAKHESAEAVLSSLDWCSKQLITQSVVNEYRHEVINYIVRLLTIIEEKENGS